MLIDFHWRKCIGDLVEVICRKLAKWSRIICIIHLKFTHTLLNPSQLESPRYENIFLLSRHRPQITCEKVYIKCSIKQNCHRKYLYGLSNSCRSYLMAPSSFPRKGEKWKGYKKTNHYLNYCYYEEQNSKCTMYHVEHGGDESLDRLRTEP